MHTAAIRLTSSEVRSRCEPAALEESRLLEACRAGDEQAFSRLLARHRRGAINLAYQLLHHSEDAEDAAQEAFVRVFTCLHQFRGQSSFRTWLYRIVINACLARRRKSTRRREDTGECATEPVAGIHVPDAVDQLETRINVHAVLDKLPDKLRAALVLRELHGLNYEQIAAALNIPVGTVRSRLHQAREAFATEWKRSEGQRP